MFYHYYYQLKNLFIVHPYMIVVPLIVAVAALIALLYICIGLFLRQTYRPKTRQYPFNIFLDRILSLIMILSPTIVVLYINPEKLSLIEKFGGIILLHIVILTPIMYSWSSHRCWFQDNNGEHVYTSWNHPELYYSIFKLCLYLGSLL